MIDAPPLPPAAAAGLEEALLLLAAGQLAEAAAAYRRAEAEAPAAAELPHRLALALAGIGRQRDALVQHFVALRRENAGLYRQTLARALADGRSDLAGASPAIRETLIGLLRAEDVSPLDIGPAALSVLQPHPGLEGLLSAASTPGVDEERMTAALETAEAQALLGDPLWLWLLSRALQTALPMEGLLTVLRRLALSRGMRPEQPAGLLADALEPLAALALQANLGSHAWLELKAEREAVEALQTQWSANPPGELDAATLLLACYRALPSDAAVPRLPAGPTVLLAEAHDRLLLSPRRRRETAALLPGLTPVAEGVSATVQAHYDANPYPRWLATNLPEPRPLPAVLAGLFPWLEAATLPQQQPLPLLIAGCGTGEQALRSARRFAGAEVLAIDLSRTALAYGQERAEAAGLTNVTFAQADIMTLGELDQRFAVIECFGVLHHLADPFAGWQVLRRLLLPGGLMRIALYRRRARAPLAEARRLLGADAAAIATADELRAARARLLRLAATEPSAAFVLRFLDAFDLDGLRDLLFHAQETDFTLPQIDDMLQRLGLEFLGFELEQAETRTAFRQLHPDPAAERDLSLWDAFEADEPESFLSMYRFWCRAAD